MFTYNAKKIDSYIGHLELRRIDFDTIESFKIDLVNKGKLSNRSINLLIGPVIEIMTKVIPKIPRINITNNPIIPTCIAALDRETILPIE